MLRWLVLGIAMLFLSACEIGLSSFENTPTNHESQARLPAPTWKTLALRRS